MPICSLISVPLTKRSAVWRVLTLYFQALSVAFEDAVIRAVITCLHNEIRDLRDFMSITMMGDV
jgi:hypothetical protein